MDESRRQMNKVDDEHHDQPNKNSLNLLAYFGKRKFDVRFLALYILGVGVISVVLTFILEGGHMSAYWWWSSIIAGLLIGTGMYFWDLKKSQKEG
jgi:hypothetical protein